MEELPLGAFGTVEDLLSHLGLVSGAKEDDRDRAVRAGSRAAGMMESVTRRSLRARTWRERVSFSGTWTLGATSVSGTSLDLVAKAYDPVSGSGIRKGTIATAVTASTLTIDKAATAAGSPATVFVGSRRLVVDGEWGQVLWIPETPVHAVYSISSLDDIGNETLLDISGIRFDRDSGKCLLPNATVPMGQRNVKISCLAGYRPPSESDPGEEADWSDLAGIWLRVAEIYYQEKKQHAGRRTSVRVGASEFAMTDDRIPRDVVNDLSRYARRP